MIGVTSVTFREDSVDKIIELCKENKVEGIEWGGDIHVPQGDISLAKDVGKKTRENGLKVLSYGSYYRICENEDIEEAFTKVLDTAVALGAPLIRIWAGNKGSKKANDDYYKRAISELKIVCNLAAKYEVKIGLEYHRNTLTDEYKSALILLKEVNEDNLYTYWQPNPDKTLEQRIEEIDNLKEYICTLHVFYWTVGNIRYPLKDGQEEWVQYLNKVDNKDCPAIIEFVKEDSYSQFKEDVSVLSKII